MITSTGKIDIRSAILGVSQDVMCLGDIYIKPITSDQELWYAVVDCKLKPGQEDFVNPAGFTIGRAYLSPADNLPCVIYLSDGTPIGYIIFRKWIGADAYSWSFYLDASWQGLGYGRMAAKLALNILKAAYPNYPIRLSAEIENTKAHKLYCSIGFTILDEKDGDDLIFEYN